MTIPFLYPMAPHVRKHGPQGYSDYASYRDWLRDEFSFRCVYCLFRERWVTGGFHLDHFTPVASAPHLVTIYDNLLYCCASCNSAKGDSIIPDPTQHLLAETVAVRTTGRLVPKTATAARIIRRLGLNRQAYCTVRRLWLTIVREIRANPKLFNDIMGFPDDLPDLSRLQPPEGNTRPEGIEQSYFAQQEREMLPAHYL